MSQLHGLEINSYLKELKILKYNFGCESATAQPTPTITKF